jgi:hypothetical protein
MEMRLASVADIRGLALYQQFIVVMMVAYALLMLGVTAQFAVNGEAIAAGTLVVAVAVGSAALTVVPAKLADN